MPGDNLERGEDVKEIWEAGYLIFWDGTDGGWLRCYDPPQLEYWR